MISHHSNPNPPPPPSQEQFLTLKKPNHEVIKTLLKREDSYLSSTSGIPFKEEWSQNQARWRPKISEWFYNIIDHFEYKREIVAIAMDYLDRFQLLLGTTSTSNTTFNGSGSAELNMNMNMNTMPMDATLYQRAAMASLYIAIKMNCGTTLTSSRSSPKYTRRLFYLDEYAELSEGRFTPEDLTEMELLICKTLNWKLNPVIPTCFLDDLLGLFLYESSTSTTNTNTLSSSSSSSSSSDPTISTTPCKRLRSSYNQNHSRTTTTTTDATMQLVLTVIYDLTCYLIEIAITSSKINFYFKSDSKENACSSSTISPSSFCYAAVLLSMSMTSSDYLTITSRNDFLVRSSTLLQVDIEEIKYLRKTILNSFIPPHVLRGLVPPEEMMIEIKNLHPLVLLRDAGILCLSFEQNLVNSLIKKRYSRSLSSSSSKVLSSSPKCVVENNRSSSSSSSSSSN